MYQVSCIVQSISFSMYSNFPGIFILFIFIVGVVSLDCGSLFCTFGHLNYFLMNFFLCIITIIYL